MPSARFEGYLLLPISSSFSTCADERRVSNGTGRASRHEKNKDRKRERGKREVSEGGQRERGAECRQRISFSIHQTLRPTRRFKPKLTHLSWNVNIWVWERLDVP